MEVKKKLLNAKTSWSVIGGLVIFISSIASTDQFRAFLQTIPPEWLPVVTGIVSAVVIIKRIFWPSAINCVDPIPEQEIQTVDNVVTSTEIPDEYKKETIS